ncbi:MAG: ribosome biogenesis GTPase Der [Candidatus Eisenbacteria bacterium]|uniref:GTPase Der n=1 Tax=Eiseniibacteriota bacterium TaxID=2212470 RepID=A0A849SFG3_UNCEI|nr:ribosome biogenesis GTPase Der [Candidatus Eisenbacteria bacterium]
MATPTVAIIGRPNVGKSTFFNRVLGVKRAVVHNRPGITRDRNTARAEWSGRHFLLVDTGGFLPAASEGRDAEVRKQAEMAIGLADVVLFMVDGLTGVTDLDNAIGQSLRRRGSRCLLIVNKVDKHGNPVEHEFHRLGLGEPIAISSEGGLGIGDLLDRVVELLPPDSGPDDEGVPRIAIVGRPNVGKSSLVNALLREERVIVEASAGTTMDSIDTRWSTNEGDFILIDTAGIRRQAQFKDEAEFFAVLRAIQAMERSDVACLIVDATHGFQRQEARLAQDALEAGRAVQLLYNKWDLMTEREQTWKALQADRERRFPTLADLPAIPISATERTHIQKLPKLFKGRMDQMTRAVPTAQLNKWLEDVQRRRQIPSNRLGRAPRLYYMTQSGKRPPEFTFFVNGPERLNESYRRFLWSQFVDRFDFQGTPIRFRYRKSQ